MLNYKYSTKYWINITNEVNEIIPSISIIVPVYNVEKQIHRCIDSILAQSFSDFELLLINDGSTDQSGNICDKYSQLDDRIRVIHLENGGVSRARNKGIELAQGKYLMFCDSDDYVEKNWCNDLYEVIEKDEYILPVSGIRVVYNLNKQKKEILRVFPQKKVFDKINYFETYKKGLSGGVWCKIYKKSIIVNNSLYFDVNLNRGEDIIFNLAYMKYMHSFVTVPSVTYNYVHSNENSLVNCYKKDLHEVNAMVYNAWSEYLISQSAKSEHLKDFATTFYLSFIKMLNNTFDKRNKDHFIKKLIHNNKILNSKEFKKCLTLADTSKEDSRYINLLKSGNYYLVWLFEQSSKLKHLLDRKQTNAS